MTKRLISLAVSLTILALLYWKIDLGKLAGIFLSCNALWMAVSLGMVVPLTLLTAWRLQMLMPAGGTLPFAEANRLILGASVLNMVLPSKMGDIAKAHAMRERGHLSGSLALSLVVFEKTCDMLSLLVWCAFGLLLFPEKDWLFWTFTAAVVGASAMGLILVASLDAARLFFDAIARVVKSPKVERMRGAWIEMHGYFWGDTGKLARIAGLSVVLWFLHLVQIWMFTLAIEHPAPFLSTVALAPLALLAGLLPLTFAGVGTRDWAIVHFFSRFMPEPACLALGLLCTARYLLPALAGLPFVSEYIASLKKTAEPAPPTPARVS